ncbi:MAG: GIY-YIG nuclease family protein [Sedimentisphaerales bacterium]
MRKTRDQILQAVKNAAHKEGIKTIGQDRFQVITGIHVAEWRYYWPRWSEVLTTAGLAPGAMVKKLDDNAVVAALIPLIREKGRWPTALEIDIYGREHPGFPAYTTIRVRGDRPTLACILLNYCSNKSEFSDIVKICEPLIVADKNDEDFDSQERIQGYIYLMKSGQFYKIGKSKSPDRRRNEIALLLPHDTKTIHVIATDDPDGIEQYWHQRFKDKHHRGEFFRLTNADVQAFKRRKDYM